MNLIKELWNKLTQLKENKKGKDNICYDIAIKYKYTQVLHTNSFDNQKTKNMSDKKLNNLWAEKENHSKENIKEI